MNNTFWILLAVGAIFGFWAPFFWLLTAMGFVAFLSIGTIVVCKGAEVFLDDKATAPKEVDPS